MTKDIQEFCSKYDAQVGPSGRVYRRSRRIPYSVWSDSDPSIFNTIPYDDVAMVEIHLPEDRFRALLEHDHFLEKSERGGNYFLGAAADIVHQYEEECLIRHSNPTVKKAWDQYRMLLELVR